MTATTSGGWTCLSVVFRAESPVHIGWHDLGTVQRTRYYIPARNLWGVLVAGIAPLIARRADGSVDYRAAKTMAGECLRVTYFYVAELEIGAPLMAPRNTDCGLKFGRLTEQQFESKYVASQTSTALDASRLTAEEGALHESEFLMSRSKDGMAVYYAGHVLLKNGGIATTDVQRVLERCAVGGDRRYGWGQLAAVSIRAIPDASFGSFRVVEWQALRDPVVEWIDSCEPAVLPAHLLYSEHADFMGELEPMSGRDWSERKGSGQETVEAHLCWAPGSVSKEPGGVRRFSIGAEGLWSAA